MMIDYKKEVFRKLFFDSVSIKFSGVNSIVTVDATLARSCLFVH